MSADTINSIAAWVGLIGFIPSLGLTLTYGLINHSAWRRSPLGRIMFTLFLAMTLVYIVFTLPKLIGRSSPEYALFSLIVFTLLMVAMWCMWIIIIYIQRKHARQEKPVSRDYRPR